MILASFLIPIMSLIIFGVGSNAIVIPPLDQFTNNLTDYDRLPARFSVISVEKFK